LGFLTWKIFLKNEKNGSFTFSREGGLIGKRKFLVTKKLQPIKTDGLRGNMMIGVFGKSRN